MKMRLRVLNTALKGLQFETDRDTVRVGRSQDNDLVLDQHSVSRFHATFTAGDGFVTLSDAGSRNQTRIDGEQISGPTQVTPGNIVSFGDVMVGLALPDGAPAATELNEEVTPAGSALVAAEEDGIRVREAGVPAPVSAAPLPAPIARAQPLDQRLWPVLTLVLGVAGAVALAAYFINRGGMLDSPERELGVSLRVGEARIVEVPSGFVHRAQVEQADILSVSRPLKLEVAIQLTGLSEGLTTVKLHHEDGRHIAVHATVEPRRKEAVLEVFAPQVRTEQDRRELARRQMRRAELLQDEGEFYKAMQAYGRALTVLEPLSKNPPEEYIQCRRWREKLSREIDECYERLQFEMSTFIKDGDKRTALHALQQMKDLITDQEDVRRQNADLLFRLLEAAIESEKRRSRRGT